MPTFKTRRGQPTDDARLRLIARAAYAHYTARMDRDPAPMHADFAAHLNADIVFVAVDAMRMVQGYTVLMLDRQASNGGWLLDNIAVHPDEQGKGIGRLLMQQCEAFLRGQDVTSYQLYTNEVMHENIDWYRGLGFVEVERRVENGFRRVYMQKRLVMECDDAG